MPILVEGLVPLIQVFDMPVAVRFYRDVLGFELVSQSHQGEEFDWCLLRLNGANVMLNTAYEREDRPPAPVAHRIAAHEDIGLFFSCPDVDAVYHHLRQNRIDCEPPKVVAYGMKQLYLKDPDGYVICFQWPEPTA